MVSETRLQGHWHQLRGRLKSNWGELTDDELQQTEGDFEQLLGLIEQKTGQARDQIERRLDEVLRSLGSAEHATGEMSLRERFEHFSATASGNYEEFSERLAEGYDRATAMVQHRPAESLAVAFGTGVLTGLIVGLIFQASRD